MLNREHGVLTLEMASFQEFVQALISRRDQVNVTRAFQFAERILKEGEGPLVTALNVAFLEHLKIDSQSGWALDAMPSSLRVQFRSAGSSR